MPTTFDPAETSSLVMLRKTAPARHKPFQHYIEVKIMPTGYTDAVATGEIDTLEAYALRCARAFGACINQRDEALNVPPPEIVKPNMTYRDEKIADAKAGWRELIAMTDEQVEVAAFNAWKEECEAYRQSRDAKRAQAKRYGEMLALVDAWQVPDALRPLRSFMMDQLGRSMEFDCTEFGDTEPQRLTGAEWKASRLENFEADVTYHTREREAEILRAAAATEWLQLLRASLK